MLESGNLGGSVRQRMWLILIALLAGACGDGSADSPSPTNADRPDTTRVATPTTSGHGAPSPTTDPAESGSGENSTALDTTGAIGPTTLTTPAVAADPQPMTWSELEQLAPSAVGALVSVEVRAFFLESCPPPDAGGGPCTLALYLAAPDRDDLLYGERNQAAAGYRAGARVSCIVGGDVTDACLGWVQRARYAVTATVIADTGRPGWALDLQSSDPIGGT